MNALRVALIEAVKTPETTSESKQPPDMTTLENAVEYKDLADDTADEPSNKTLDDTPTEDESEDNKTPEVKPKTGIQSHAHPMKTTSSMSVGTVPDTVSSQK